MTNRLPTTRPHSTRLPTTRLPGALRRLACAAVLTLCAAAAVVPTATAQRTPQAAWRAPYVQPDESDRLRDFRARRDSVIDLLANQVPPTDVRAGGYLNIAADLYRGRDLAWCVARLDALLSEPPRGDMFWMYPFTVAMYAGRDRLPPDTRARMRDAWRTYMPYRGDTENHWAMYYASMYLVAEMYPADGPETWFNGKSSQENMDEARDYLRHWIDLTISRGQGEYDSPGYMSFYVAPMAMLAGFSADPEMQQRGRMMLDYLLADYYAETLDGVHVGASSRIYPNPLFRRWTENGAGHAWLLFGNTPFLLRGEAVILALSGYEPPAILHAIATDRSQPYLQRELKRTRHRMRNSDVRNVPVYKQTYIAPAYAVGSTQGGSLQPIQQHTWEVAWRLADPRQGRNVMFSLHPSSSPREGTMYFAEPWHMVTDLIVRSKTEYDSATKWTGGSPYEQVAQSDDAIVALYDIPADARFGHVSGYFSKTLRERTDENRTDENRRGDASGWIFARGGDAFLAYRPLAPFEWRTEADSSLRLHSPYRQNGTVVQAAAAADYASFDAFKAAVRALPLSFTLAPTPRVRFTTLRGVTIEATYGETPRIGGVAVDFAGWPLYDGPFLRAAADSRRLEMRHGRLRRTLDFTTLTVTDTVAPD